MPPDRIVILSASLAGVLTAKYLSWERIPHVEIEIIHCDAYFEFSPFLFELIVGSISSKTLRVPLDKSLSKVKSRSERSTLLTIRSVVLICWNLIRGKAAQ